MSFFDLLSQNVGNLPTWAVMALALFTVVVGPGLAFLGRRLEKMFELRRIEVEAETVERSGLVNHVLKENEDLKLRISALDGRLSNLQFKSQHTAVYGEGSSIAMSITGLGGERIWQNQAYEDLTGMPLLSCQGLTNTEILSEHPGIADLWNENNQRVIDSGEAIECVEIMFHADKPEDPFLCVTWKWPTKLGQSVLGVQAAAVRIETVEQTVQAHAHLLRELGCDFKVHI